MSKRVSINVEEWHDGRLMYSWWNVRPKFGWKWLWLWLLRHGSKV